MRDHAGPCLWRQRRGFELLGIYVVGGHLNVHEHRHQAILDDGIDRGRKSGSDRDDLVAGPQPALAQLRRGQACQRQQVGGRAGVYQRRMTQAPEAREGTLEFGGIAPRCQPKVEGAIDEVDEIVVIEDAAAKRNRRGSRVKRLRRKGRLMIGANQVQDFRAELFRCLIHG